MWGVIWYNESFVTLFGFGHRLSSSDYAVYINFTKLKTAVNSCSPSPKSSRHVASLLKVGGGGDASKTSWQAKKTLQDHENLRQEVGGTHPMLHVCQRFKCNAFPYKIFSLPPVIKQMKKILKLSLGSVDLLLRWGSFLTCKVYAFINLKCSEFCFTRYAAAELAVGI